jgi:hypothetical protein
MTPEFLIGPNELAFSNANRFKNNANGFPSPSYRAQLRQRVLLAPGSRQQPLRLSSLCTSVRLLPRPISRSPELLLPKSVISLALFKSHTPVYTLPPILRIPARLRKLGFRQRNRKKWALRISRMSRRFASFCRASSGIHDCMRVCGYAATSIKPCLVTTRPWSFMHFGAATRCITPPTCTQPCMKRILRREEDPANNSDGNGISLFIVGEKCS